MSAAVLMWAQGSLPSHEKPPGITAQMACSTLPGKSIGGAALTAVVVEADKGTPSYCKVNGTLAPSLNFEIRMPDNWNGKLYYGGGGGYGGSIPPLSVPP
ncbi:MAG TPA: hypothetical protein VMU80_10895, partial [Bryobacteraceae bacterium]|nr:hypothetical protein [Bryobacteraceae bacterium]